jgi:hypothetical protein
MRALPLLLLLPVVASAGDRLSFITVDQDNQYTALSTITCKIRASRVPPTGTFSGTVTFEWRSMNPSQVGYSDTVPFEVSPQVPTYSEMSETGEGITATLVKSRVLVVFKTRAPLSADDIVFCNAEINSGPLSAPTWLIYAANLQYTDQTKN